ncbi:MAG TPA: hypothetical protein VK504_07720 [Vicinamibacterales bacterium]|nr:hypothetical protein [Vicinamibacterales bacterium]
MNDNSSLDLESSADDDIDTDTEINALRLNCITQIISARPITVRLVDALLTQGSQPARRKRRRRNVAEATGGGA